MREEEAQFQLENLELLLQEAKTLVNELKEFFEREALKEY